MPNPNKLFVCSAISRRGIADDLNTYLDDNEALTDDRLTPGDARLTDKICAAYADELGKIWATEDDLTTSEADDALCDLYDKYLRLLGIDPSCST